MALQEELEIQGNSLFKHRGVWPLSILVVGLALTIRPYIHPESTWLEMIPGVKYYDLFSISIGMAGLVIRILTIGYAAPNTSGRNTKAQIADKINTKGIYSTVRHPLYVGNFLMWFGVALSTHNLWFIAVFTLLYWIYYERIIFAEEQFLRKKFGTSYINWSKKVNCVIPDISRYQKPEHKFNFRKVLRQEKNGFAALFFLYALIDSVRETVSKEYQYNYYLIGLAILSILLYFVLKILKYKTNLLKDK
jgi:protein-S-isoprenylcysteine O-methyltransferase Ste14